MLFFYSVPSLMFNCDFAINSLKFVVVLAATDFNARPWIGPPKVLVAAIHALIVIQRMVDR